MTSSGPGKSHRTGITLLELGEFFPDEDAARAWFEAKVWPDGRACPHCGSRRTHEASHKNSPYRCSDCRHYFSVKTGTLLEASRVPLRKWAVAIYLEVTSLKGISSMKLHRDIGVTQKTAWFMLHRLREAWADDAPPPFLGPIEADEMYLGGRNKNKPVSQRETIGGGPRGKQAIVGVKDRATNTVRAAAVATTAWDVLRGYVEGPGARHRARLHRRAPRVPGAPSPPRDGHAQRPRVRAGMRSTPTASSPSGRCSSGATTRRSTGSARSTSSAISTSSRAGTASASTTRSSRWRSPRTG